MKGSVLKLSDVKFIKLGDIKGIHPNIIQIFNDVGADLPSGYNLPFEDSALLDAIALFPITLHRYRNQNYCIAGIYNYRIACNQLFSETFIPVRFYEGRRGDQLDRLIIAELLSSQLIQTKPSKSPILPWLYKVWRLVRKNSKYKVLNMSDSKSAYSKALKINPKVLSGK
ncbi:MAG: hypothetical protein HWE39_18300 [Oceanospirillaceae bacterium]|nr:hypothetical protein [Oceanospirillaceae bacterium]